MKHWRKLFLFVGLPIALIVTFFAWSSNGFFGGKEICTTCGRMKSTSRTLWISSSKIKETELSHFYDDYKGEDDHRHTWLFASGGGGSITCAIGKGRHLYSTVLKEESRHALELIRLKRGDEAVERWLDRLLDPELSRDAYSALMFLTDASIEFDSGYREAEETFAINHPPATTQVQD